jgi:hypothetical protein
MNDLRAVLLTGTLLAAGSGFADESVSMEPGQWEMTTTMQMSMLPQPQVRTSTECITETEFNPDQINTDPDSPCENSDVRVDGQTITWKITCPSEMGSMQGEWSFTSEGDAIRGTGNMSAMMNSQEMKFDMTWEGRRVGACP